MPAILEEAACVGFWPSLMKGGEDLLVYASNHGGSNYITAICGFHKAAIDAARDFKALGPGKEPEKSAKIPK